MKTKSLNINAVTYAMNSLMGIIFPLITFPYISRILGVEMLGGYNFAVSVISYILIFARLGISFYAVREGARFRDNKEKFKIFADQIFTINIFTAIFAYVLFLLLLVVVPKLRDYQQLLFVLSIQVFFVPIAVDWVYTIYEDFFYVTIRNIAVQVISIILLFIFVKTSDDVINYAFLTVVSSMGSAIFNFIYAKKYTKICLTKTLKIKKHLKPIITLFAMNIATTIFATSDMVMLGFMSDDKAIGIYSVSVKIYNLVKVVAASVVAVAIPRIASLIEKKDVGELKRSVNRIFNLLLMVTVPIVVGLIVLREEAILIISSKEYITSAVPLAILSVDIFFNLVAYFWGQAILVPFKRDKELLKITVFSAILNIILNIILIPYFNEVATALTTLVAEFVWMVLCRREGMKLVGKMKSTKQFLKVVAGSLPIVAFSVTLKMFMTNMYLYIAVLVLLSGVAYFLIELLLKNEVFDEIFNQFKKKINNQEK